MINPRAKLNFWLRANKGQVLAQHLPFSAPVESGAEKKKGDSDPIQQPMGERSAVEAMRRAYS
jgi:hypothetical protein